MSMSMPQHSQMSWTIRLARASDALNLPVLEQSASERFRNIRNLAWIADDVNMSVDRHLQFIERGTEWVAVDGSGELLGFLAGECVGRDLHIWELAVRLDAQRGGIG